VACPAGTSKGSIGPDACAPCPGNTYQDAAGSTACNACPADTYHNLTRQTSYSVCQCTEAGFYLLDVALVCALCDNPIPDNAVYSGPGAFNKKDSCPWACKPDYFTSGDFSCAVCDFASCGVGQFRSPCTSKASGVCTSCTSGPSNSEYTSPGKPYDADNCEWKCVEGYYNSGGKCSPCTTTECPAGQLRSDCTADSDGTCVDCSFIVVPENAVFVKGCEFACADGFSDKGGVCVQDAPITITMSLGMSAAEFEGIRTSFVEAIAATAGVDPSTITLEVKARRSLIASSPTDLIQFGLIQDDAFLSRKKYGEADTMVPLVASSSSASFSSSSSSSSKAQGVPARRQSGSVTVTVVIAASIDSVRAIDSKISSTSINQEMVKRGLPQVTSMQKTVNTGTGAAPSPTSTVQIASIVVTYHGLEFESKQCPNASDDCALYTSGAFIGPREAHCGSQCRMQINDRKEVAELWQLCVTDLVISLLLIVSHFSKNLRDPPPMLMMIMMMLMLNSLSCLSIPPPSSLLFLPFQSLAFLLQLFLQLTRGGRVFGGFHQILRIYACTYMYVYCLGVDWFCPETIEPVLNCCCSTNHSSDLLPCPAARPPSPALLLHQQGFYYFLLVMLRNDLELWDFNLLILMMLCILGLGIKSVALVLARAYRNTSSFVLGKQCVSSSAFKNTVSELSVHADRIVGIGAVEVTLSILMLLFVTWALVSSRIFAGVTSYQKPPETIKAPLFYISMGVMALARLTFSASSIAVSITADKDATKVFNGFSQAGLVDGEDGFCFRFRRIVPGDFAPAPGSGEAMPLTPGEADGIAMGITLVLFGIFASLYYMRAIKRRAQIPKGKEVENAANALRRPMLYDESAGVQYKAQKLVVMDLVYTSLTGQKFHHVEMVPESEAGTYRAEHEEKEAERERGREASGKIKQDAEEKRAAEKAKIAAMEANRGPKNNKKVKRQAKPFRDASDPLPPAPKPPIWAVSGPSPPARWKDVSAGGGEARGDEASEGVEVHLVDVADDEPSTSASSSLASSSLPNIPLATAAAPASLPDDGDDVRDAPSARKPPSPLKAATGPPGPAPVKSSATDSKKSPSPPKKTPAKVVGAFNPAGVSPPPPRKASPASPAPAPAPAPASNSSPSSPVVVTASSAPKAMAFGDSTKMGRAEMRKEFERDMQAMARQQQQQRRRRATAGDKGGMEGEAARGKGGGDKETKSVADKGERAKKKAQAKSGTVDKKPAPGSSGGAGAGQIGPIESGIV
jgi:hypothetical protein